ncbi:MAG: hypothetical protein KA116_00270 [Proteobacteria bacterium]|jgi:UDP-2,3-diacylglucosamine pyrophosphatase LpxH|nr:hypothetical protein [Pseudomonadota bacterium]
MAKKYKIVVSDFHLGKGRLLPDGSINVLEDFIAGREWQEFCEFYSSGPFFDAEVELILNGDILNSIQVDYRGYYSPIITESIAVEKVKSIMNGHPKFFEALKKFADCPKHTLTYIVGNHDIDMVWDKCKEVFIEKLGVPVKFKHFSYQVDGIHYEHGQQYEAVNAVNRKKIFITKGLKEPILNLPWGSHFVINFVIPIKHERPLIDKVRPIAAYIRWSLIFDFFWAIRTMTQALLYFFGTRFSRSLYRTSNLVTTLKILKELSMVPELSSAARKILDADPDLHTVIMGHTHSPKYVQFSDGKEYLNSGTWTEVTSLNLTNLGKHIAYTYIIVDYNHNPTRPHAFLKEWKGRWHQDGDYYAG